MEKEVCAKSNEQHETRRLRKEIQRCEKLVKAADENIKLTNKLLSEKIDESKIEKMIDSKLEKIEAIILNQQKVADTKTYASATSTAPQNDFKTIMKMAKLEEIADERDRRSRENNMGESLIQHVGNYQRNTEVRSTFEDYRSIDK